MWKVHRALLEMVEGGEAAALVTVVETKGSAPAGIGFKMVVGARGRIAGTVGGGPLEEEAIQAAFEAIKDNSCRLFHRSLNAAEAEEAGMICGGDVTLFIEPYVSPETVLIIGAGHISQQLAALAKIAGFAVTVIDDRAEFCNRRLFPEADCLLVGEIEELLDREKITPRTFVVIVTRGHRYDLLALEKTLSSPAAYLGMIGSSQKVEATFNNLLHSGIKPEELAAVHAPIGLRIGAQTPAEIAVSILAEIIAVKRKVFQGRDPASMSNDGK